MARCRRQPGRALPGTIAPRGMAARPTCHSHRPSHTCPGGRALCADRGAGGVRGSDVEAARCRNSHRWRGAAALGLVATHTHPQAQGNPREPLDSDSSLEGAAGCGGPSRLPSALSLGTVVETFPATAQQPVGRARSVQRPEIVCSAGASTLGPPPSAPQQLTHFARRALRGGHRAWNLPMPSRVWPPFRSCWWLWGCLPPSSSGACPMSPRFGELNQPPMAPRPRPLAVLVRGPTRAAWPTSRLLSRCATRYCCCAAAPLHTRCCAPSGWQCPPASCRPGRPGLRPRAMAQPPSPRQALSLPFRWAHTRSQARPQLQRKALSGFAQRSPSASAFSGPPSRPGSGWGWGSSPPFRPTCGFGECWAGARAAIPLAAMRRAELQLSKFFLFYRTSARALASPRFLTPRPPPPSCVRTGSGGGALEHRRAGS